MKRSLAAAALLTTLLAAAPAPLCQGEEPKPGSFAYKVSTAIQPPLFIGMEYGINPGFEFFTLSEKWEKMQAHADENSPNRDVAYARAGSGDLRTLKSFPDDLLKELRSSGKDRTRALAYLCTMTSMIHLNCGVRGDDGVDALRVALGRYAEPVQSSLEEALKKAEAKDAFFAAAVMLQLVPDHARAIDMVIAEVKVGDNKRRAETLGLVGDLRMSQPRIVAALVEALEDKDLDIRRAAAQAAWLIGPKAARTVPGLINLLKTGDGACGEYRCKFVLSLPRTKNFALAGLGEMGPDAREAVPIIAGMLKDANNEKRLELLTCLARLGPVATDAGPAIRHVMAKQKNDCVPMAVALLCIDPTDEEATKSVIAALTNGGDESTQAMTVCATMGPKVKALVPRFLVALKTKGAESEIQAPATALGNMGSLAEPAIPALIDLLSNNHVDVRTYEPAYYALGSIGKASVPELVRVIRNKDLRAREYAVRALGQIGPSAAKETVPILIEALADKDGRVQRHAAIALGTLRSRAAPARQALTRQVDRYGDLFSAWALTQLSR